MKVSKSLIAAETPFLLLAKLSCTPDFQKILSLKKTIPKISTFLINFLSSRDDQIFY